MVVVVAFEPDWDRTHPSALETRCRLFCVEQYVVPWGRTFSNCLQHKFRKC